MGLETFYRATCDKCGAASESFAGWEFNCKKGLWFCASCRNALDYDIHTSGDATYEPGDDHDMVYRDE